MTRLAGSLVSLWLYSMAADGLATMLSTVLRAVGLPGVLGPLLGLTTMSTLLLWPLVWLAWIGTPRVPWALVVLPSAAFLWVSTAMVPLFFHLSWDGAMAFGGLVSLLAGGLPLGLLAWRTGVPWLDTSKGTTPAFRPLRSLLLLLTVPGLTTLATLGWVSHTVDSFMRWGSGDFVGLGWEGVQVAHRVYERGDTTIQLMAMAHIGLPATYDALNAAVPEGAAVLMEGVTDHKAGPAEPSPPYPAAAKALGLASQPMLIGGGRGRGIHADIDVSDISPEVLALIEPLMAAYETEDTEAQLASISTYMERAQDVGEELPELFWHDIVENRNARVLEVLDETLPTHHQIVIPWGGIHMAGISAGVLERGFHEVSTTWRTIVPWPWTER